MLFNDSRVVINKSMNSKYYVWISFILVVCNPSSTGYVWSQHGLDYRDLTNGLPEFEMRQPTELMAVVGQTVLMPCTVYNLGDKTVAWIRNRDLNILTHGPATFTADQRFSVDSNIDGDTWTLSLKAVRLNDTGRYECQVNTDPKMSLFFKLVVKEHSPTIITTFISGPREQYVQTGSTISYTCTVNYDSISDTNYVGKVSDTSVTWLHNGLAVSFQSNRGGIAVETDHNEHGSISKLTVADVQSDDAGRYTCSSNGVSDTVVLIVIKHGKDYDDNYIDVEHMEAMQRDEAVSSHSTKKHIKNKLLIAIIIILIEVG